MLFCRMSEAAFDSMRLWLCLILSLLRIVSAPSCFQAYLNIAQTRIESMKKEAGRISNVELQRKVDQIENLWLLNYSNISFNRSLSFSTTSA